MKNDVLKANDNEQKILEANFKRLLEKYPELYNYDFTFTEFMYPIYVFKASLIMKRYENYKFLDEYILKLASIGMSARDIKKYLALPGNQTTVDTRLEALRIKGVIKEANGIYTITGNGIKSLNNNKLVYDTTSNVTDLDTYIQVEGLNNEVLPLHLRVEEKDNNSTSFPTIDYKITEFDEENIRDSFIKKLLDDSLYDMEIIDRNISSCTDMRWDKTIFYPLEMVTIRDKDNKPRRYFFSMSKLNLVLSILNITIVDNTKYQIELNENGYFKCRVNDIVSFYSGNKRLKSRAVITNKIIKDNKCYIICNVNNVANEILDSIGIRLNSDRLDYKYYGPFKRNLFENDQYKHSASLKSLNMNNTVCYENENKEAFEIFLDDMTSSLPLIYQGDLSFTVDFNKLEKYNSNYDYDMLFRILFNSFLNKNKYLYAGSITKSEPLNDDGKPLEYQLYYRYTYKVNVDFSRIKKIYSFIYNYIFIDTTQFIIDRGLDYSLISNSDKKALYVKYESYYRDRKYSWLQELFKDSNKGLSEFLNSVSVNKLFDNVKSRLCAMEYAENLFCSLKGLDKTYKEPAIENNDRLEPKEEGLEENLNLAKKLRRVEPKREESEKVTDLNLNKALRKVEGSIEGKAKPKKTDPKPSSSPKAQDEDKKELNSNNMADSLIQGAFKK